MTGTARDCRAVVFDLYETLVTEFDPEWRPRATVAERLGLGEAAFREAWSRLKREQYWVSDVDYGAVLRLICLEAAIDVDETLLEALRAERLAAKAGPFARVEPVILALLAELRGRGLRLGLISNCGAEDVAAWNGSALAPWFDVTVFSCQVGCRKPEPLIYQQACERLA